MYPLVELLTGLLFLACFYVFGISVETAKWAAFSAIMVVLVFTDLRERILPGRSEFHGFRHRPAFQFVHQADGRHGLWLANHLFDFPPPAPVISFVDALLGAAVGSGLLWLVSEAYFRLRGREGMGLGDVKMMLMAGAFLGAKRTLLTILAGSLLGSVLGLALFWRGGKIRITNCPLARFSARARCWWFSSAPRS